jgi:hypothetical protein
MPAGMLIKTNIDSFSANVQALSLAGKKLDGLYGLRLPAPRDWAEYHLASCLNHAYK